MNRNVCALCLLFFLALLVACASEPVEVTRVVIEEVIKEVEVTVEAEPFATPPLTIAPGADRLGEGSAQLVAEDEQSTGQEDRARPTPLAPRDKQNDLAQVEAVADLTQDMQVAQQAGAVATVVESAESTTTTTTQPIIPRSDNIATATPAIDTPSATFTPAATQQAPATPEPTIISSSQATDLVAELASWVLLSCGTFH